MNKLVNVSKSRLASGALLAGVFSAFSAAAHAADPATLEALQTEIAGKFTAVETIVISGFVLGSAIVVGMITLHWVNRGSRGKVK